MGAPRCLAQHVVADSVLIFLVSFFLASLSIALSREPGSIASEPRSLVAG